MLTPALDSLSAHEWARAPWKAWSCQLARRPLRQRLMIATLAVVFMSVGMGGLAWLSWQDVSVAWWQWGAWPLLAALGMAAWTFEQKRDERAWKGLLSHLSQLPVATRQQLAHSPEVPAFIREGLLVDLSALLPCACPLSQWKGPSEFELTWGRRPTLTTVPGIALVLSFGVLWAGVSSLFNPHVGGAVSFVLLLSGFVVWAVPFVFEVQRHERHRAAAWERYWCKQGWSKAYGRQVWERLPEGEPRERLADHLSLHFPGWSLEPCHPLPQA